MVRVAQLASALPLARSRQHGSRADQPPSAPPAAYVVRDVRGTLPHGLQYGTHDAIPAPIPTSISGRDLWPRSLASIAICHRRHD